MFEAVVKQCATFRCHGLLVTGFDRMEMMPEMRTTLENGMGDKHWVCGLAEESDADVECKWNAKHSWKHAHGGDSTW